MLLAKVRDMGYIFSFPIVFLLKKDVNNSKLKMRIKGVN